MAVPRNRTSNARKNNRRSHHAKKLKSFASCSRCDTRRMSHSICPSCGTYDGRVMIQAKEETGE